MSAESICRRVPLAVKYNKEIYDAYVKIIGESDMMLVKDAAIEDTVYAFDFKEKPSDIQMQRMLQYVQSALDLGRNGVQGGIELDTAMKIESMILRGANLEEVRLMLSYEIKKYNERMASEAQAREQANTDRMMAAEQQKSNNEMNKQRMEIDGDLAVERLKGENKKEQIILEKNRESMRGLMELAAKEKENANQLQ